MKVKRKLKVLFYSSALYTQDSRKVLTKWELLQEGDVPVLSLFMANTDSKEQCPGVVSFQLPPALRFSMFISI